MKKSTPRERELVKEIEKLIARIRQMEEQLRREKFENETLKSTIADLRKELKEKQSELSQIQGAS
jgi:predicted RNase H-like nuclease (RuvC/YqgF family)